MEARTSQLTDLAKRKTTAFRHDASISAFGTPGTGGNAAACVVDEIALIEQTVYTLPYRISRVKGTSLTPALSPRRGRSCGAALPVIKA